MRTLIHPRDTLGRILSVVALIAAAGLMSTQPALAVSSCGADGERACCAGTFEVLLGNACDAGNVEVGGCSGDCTCGGFNPFGINASGTCKATADCGGEGQRACCDGLSEGRACDAGLIKIEGCTGNCYCGGDIATGQVSVHTCAKPAPCGGPGQRACCFEEPGGNGQACQSGLVEVPGCTGDCSCAILDGAGLLGGLPETSTGTCAPPDRNLVAVEEPSTGWTAPSTPRSCDIRGYADLHMHLNAHLAHGGKVFAGAAAPIDAGDDFALDEFNNISSALSAADDAALHSGHGIFGDTVGDGTQDGSTGNGGAPLFNNWPTWTSTTHQQMYYKWLERAFRGGMRLTTMLAVTNEALCKSTDGTDCANSMGAIDDQIDAAYAFQAFIDSQCELNPGSDFCVEDSGTEEGWFRIVTDPLQARQVIQQGKLAVVLGIEVDNLFNCKEQNSNRPAAVCPNMRDASGELVRNAQGEPIDTVAKAVDHYFDKGVRHFFPIHNFDNAFGGAATWQDVIAVGNAFSEQRWWEVEACSEYGYSLPPPIGFDNAFLLLVAQLGFDGEVPPLPGFFGSPSCNRFGLNLDAASPGPDDRGLGMELLEALMDNGMIIDIDHMSRKSLDDTLELTRQYAGHPGEPQYQYPLVASHVQFFDLHDRTFEGRAGRHERMRTREQLEAIRDGGGMIAAMTKDDVQDTGLKSKKFTNAYTTPLFGAAIPDNCRHSSVTFTQAYQYAVDIMGAPVALGSDFNGIAGHIGPRFGNDACGGDLPLSVEAGSITERSAQLRAGNRLQYPFTIDGFGSFEKQETGFKTFDFNVDGLAHVGLLPDLVKDMEQIGLDETYVDALFSSAEEYIRVWERAVRISAVANNQTLPDAPPPDLTCPSPSLCQGDGNTPPQIACPQDVVTECTGVETVAAFPPPEPIEGSCGAAVIQGCIPATGSNFTAGFNWVTCSVIDSARNDASCDFRVTIQDTLLPDIAPPADLAGVECTSAQGASPALGQATATDICDAAPAIDNDAPSVLPVGTNSVTWLATDAGGNSRSAVQRVEVVDTIPPQITCPADIVKECTGNHSATVTPDSATGQDICSDVVTLTRPEEQSFGLGTNELTYVATDRQGLQSSCTSTVVVRDTTPPTITAVVPSPQTLWPPNHELRNVTVEVTSTDTCDNAVPVCRVTGITSSEPADGNGDGNTGTDFQWDAEQTGSPLDIVLRAERDGSGTGRVYTVDIACSDEAGNVTTAQTSVLAPKN